MQQGRPGRGGEVVGRSTGDALGGFAGGGLSAEQVAEKLRQQIERQEKYGMQYWKVVLKEERPDHWLLPVATV